jgi:hypothetical protein
MVAAVVFTTFLKQGGPQDAKMEGDGEKFRMSERQRVRGTSVTVHFDEACGNLVAKTW